MPGAQPIAKTLANFNVEVWFGILAPAKTPPDVVAKLQGTLKKVLADDDIKSRFAGFGFEAVSSTPQELGDIITAEAGEWRRVIEERGIRGE
jgi:tripartite-type tricarboxylate transporter receptor subunit TctC